ncbi:conjugative transposon protein TraM [Filimonas effusa]|uniref:Conjugative transposon protein TraM n=1 Tax=Filimonas effusa TaxID=2508721 RepID=A0A4Q1D0L7_9BACT|nr:conjugative transposon protein TraM [Filimonas effusa]RXK81296.1 conjugative transposon protein TraM [Filimonas effusa]
MQSQNTKQALSAKTERQRKFLLFFPLFSFPLFTFVLWSLGVIVPVDSTAQTEQAHKGINMTLPDASIKDEKNLTKLSFYEQAERDSAKWKAQAKNDPYYKLPDSDLLTDTAAGRPFSTGTHLSYDPSPYGQPGYKNDKEAKVYEKIAALNRQLEQSASDSQPTAVKASPSPGMSAGGMTTADVDRLEGMMRSMAEGKEEDPELKQLNGMLESILDIQHPERVQEKIRKNSVRNKEKVFPVNRQKQQTISLLQSPSTPQLLPDTLVRKDSTALTVSPLAQSNAFFSLDEDTDTGGDLPTAIEAVVHATQTIVSGATIKLRLTTDVYINGLFIPSGSFVYGAAALNGERLTVNIKSVAYKNNILPVALSVYDMDGMEGLYMPGAIARDVMKQSTDQTIQGIGLTSLDPSLAAQATSAGIGAAKSLLSKKVKLVRVTIKEGYKVLLRDNNVQ